MGQNISEVVKAINAALYLVGQIAQALHQLALIAWLDRREEEAFGRDGELAKSATAKSLLKSNMRTRSKSSTRFFHLSGTWSNLAVLRYGSLVLTEVFFQCGVDCVWTVEAADVRRVRDDE